MCLPLFLQQAHLKQALEHTLAVLRSLNRRLRSAALLLGKDGPQGQNQLLDPIRDLPGY